VRKGMLGGEADFNRDGRVSVQEGFRLAAEKAPVFTAHAAQGPQHPYIAGGDGTELFLADPFPVAGAVAGAPAAPAVGPAAPDLVPARSGTPADNSRFKKY